ncbi:TonB-dependent receptor [Sphingobium sp. SA2]|uniref:TonB-dependent receptor domain-containing protein n=1 Tax=Sphingobium sp. SA2 TaxID=1524832 RepID=UPI0028C0A95C|nr:TonB-dependent receptor [Sphingobium sp. SA2]MDT7533130.1 TonB-dependent receptor [Sphingobium sp. SA2]
MRLITGMMCTLLSTTSVYAQTTPASDAAPVIAQADSIESTPAAPAAADITVTGSRIARQDYTASSPIVTLGVAAIENRGAVTIESALNDLPQFTPSTGQANAFPSRGGQANLNLRGLGTNRALVLISGRRAQPSNGDGTIDVNTIPRQLIQNVETITGGASATYGSDAMAGVVNFKLRDRFEGIQIDGQYNLTTRGDAAARQLGLLAGTDFAQGRGNVFVALDYTSRERVQRRDRSFFTENGTVNIAFLPTGVADLSANPPSQLAVNGVFNRYGTPPATVSRTRGFGVNNDGSLFTANPVTAPIFNYKGPIDDLIRSQNNTLLQASGLYYDIQIPLERFNGFARAEYELSDTLKAFVQGQYTAYVADVGISITPLGSLGQVTFVPATNPFIPADLKTLLNSRSNPAGDFVYNKLLFPLGPRTQREEWDLYQVVAGLSGDITSLGWTWDVSFTHGRTENQSTLRGGVSASALQQLLRDPFGGAGRPASGAVAAVSPLCEGGLNLFGDQPISQSCQSFILREAVNTTVLKQETAEANIQGTVLTLPAGPLKFAAGATYRRNRYAFTADPVVAAADLTGYGASRSGGGSTEVGEIYAELLAPLIHDTPFIKEFNLGAAYRYSNYDSIGGVSAYKADIDWAIVDEVRVRGGYSRAVRAPSVGELFAAPNSVGVTLGAPLSPTGAPAFTGDPCDVRGAYRTGPNGARVSALCVAQGVPASAIAGYTYVGNTVFATNEGNAALREESADTYSIGLVLKSPFATSVLSRLTASIDYYNISISDAIGVLGVPVALSRCFNGDGVSNPNYDPTNINCQQIDRSPGTGAIANPTQPLLNLASFKTSGIDGQIDWVLPLESVVGGNPGALRFNLIGTYVDRFLVRSLPGSPELDFIGTTGNGGIVQPQWKSVVSATYSKDMFSLGFTWRHLSSVEDSSRVTNAASIIPGVPAYDYFDMNVRIGVNENFEIRGGVTNIANKAPPQVGSAFGNTDTSTYDVLGRQAFISFRARI